MEDREKQVKFLVCPECRGSGFIRGKKCKKCRGIGVALVLQNKVLFWNQFYSKSQMAYEKSTEMIKKIFNLLIGLFGLSGIFVVIYYGYINGFESFLNLSYWLEPSGEKLYFWITLMADLYLYYRLEQEFSGKNKVISKIYKTEESHPHSDFDFDTIWSLKSVQMVDVSKSFTPDARKAVFASWQLAKTFGHDEVLRIHLYGVLPQFDQSAVILARLGIKFEEFKQKMGSYLTKNIISRGVEPIISSNLHKVLLLAYLEAYDNNKQNVDVADSILALCLPGKIGLTEKDDIEELLIDIELDYQKVINVVEWVRIQKHLRENLQRFRSKARLKPKSGIDRAMTAIATPILDQFSDDLTLKAKRGHLFPCIGRDKEIENIFRIMEGSREGVLLIGNQGVGRTTIIEGLAQKMVEEDVPEILQDKRLVLLDVARLLAGADAATAEQRLLMLSNEIIHSGNIVLAVENLHNMSGISAGKDSSLDLSEVFAQVMSKHSFHVIATTNGKEYSRAIENKSLDAVFQVIKINELETNDAILVLEAKSGPIEYRNKVYFSYSAIETAVDLSDRYIHDKYLPEKGIDILEQAAIKVAKERGVKKIVGDQDVAEIISNMTGIPAMKVTQDETDKLLHLEEKFHERMIDQEEAVSLVATSLRRARAELRDNKRPIANLLFLGPTGVGKTELAKTVAEVYFNSEDAMIRIDMSEYQEKSSVSRLIGAGDDVGILTEQVRKNPFALVLFDEVEKAHPDILNLFLQMMDDGRLTDNLGRVIDFTSTIIIMTSNAEAQFISDEIKKGSTIDQIKQELINEKLKGKFRPEFLNRLDGVVVFKPLGMKEVIAIARLLVDKVIKNLDGKGIDFSVTDGAIAELAEQGFDPKFGARPLRRTIETRIDDELAKQLLEGKIGRRDKVIYDVGGEIRVEKADKI